LTVTQLWRYNSKIVERSQASESKGPCGIENREAPRRKPAFLFFIFNTFEGFPVIHKASDVKPPPLPAIEESAASEFAPVPSQGVSVPPFSGGFTPPPAPVAAEARRQNLPTDEPLADEKDRIPAWLRSILDRFTLRETPSWLTSLMVHLAIILLLAIIPLSEKIGSSITIFSGAADSEGDDELPVMDVSASEDSSDTTDSLADQLNIEAVSVESLTVPVPEVNMDLKVDSAISGGLKGRTGAMKEALLKAYGGTAGTELSPWDLPG
jgi:hypothetical protein